MGPLFLLLQEEAPLSNWRKGQNPDTCEGQMRNSLLPQQRTEACPMPAVRRHRWPPPPDGPEGLARRRGHLLTPSSILRVRAKSFLLRSAAFCPFPPAHISALTSAGGGSGGRARDPHTAAAQDSLSQNDYRVMQTKHMTWERHLHFHSLAIR